MPYVWPDIGSINPVPVFVEPIKKDDETDDAFAKRMRAFEAQPKLIAHVRLLEKPAMREWGNGVSAAIAREQLKEKSAKDRGEELVGWSPEGGEEFVNLNKRLVAQALDRIEGAMVGSVDLGVSGIDGAKLAAYCEHMDLLAAIADACQRGQHPKPKQLDSSGS